MFEQPQFLIGLNKLWTLGLVRLKSETENCFDAAGGKEPSGAPKSLRMQSCARFCHDSVGELEQIQFLLRHVSVQTTEKYLGCKQRLREAVNDRIGIEHVFR